MRNDIKNNQRNNWALTNYLFCIIFFSSYFFGLYGYLNISIYRETLALSGILIVSVLFLIVSLFYSKGILNIQKNTRGWLVFTLAIIMAELVVTSRVATSQPFVLTLAEAYPYLLIVIVYFVLRLLIRSREDILVFLNVIEVASLVIAIFALLQFLLYPNVIIFTLDNLTIRNNLPRIFLGGNIVPVFGTLISFAKIVSKKNDHRISIVNLVLEIIKLAVIEQQRGALLILFALMIFIVFTYISNKYIRVLLYSLVTVAVIVIALLSDVSTLINSTFRFDNDFSLDARTESIRFFCEKAKQYPMLGMGFITSSKNQDPISYAILNNQRGYHCQRSDVGIFGLLNMWGIIGVFWYLMFLKKIFYYYKKCEEEWRDLVNVLFVFTFLSSFNLIIADMQRVLLMPLFLIVAEKCAEFSYSQKVE